MIIRPLFITLLSISTLVASSNTIADNTKPMPAAEKMAMMKHVTPMPGLMRIVVMHGYMLDLSKEQQAELKKWRDANGPVVEKTAKEIVALEKEITAATITGENAAMIVAKATVSLGKRDEIIKTKVKCRDNLKRVLNDEQWEMVVTMYQDMHAEK